MDRNPNENVANRNPNENLGAAGAGQSAQSGTPQPGMSGGQRSFGSGSSNPDETSFGERDIGHRAEQMKNTVKDRLGTAREKASQFQSTLADKLDQGAERLRHRVEHRGGAQFAGATEGGTASMARDDRMARATDSIASGMHNTADWLRNGDLRADLERQVHDHPGRSLLVALGLGYVIGKSLRR